MVRRHKNHITETKSLKIFTRLMPNEWVIRDLSERDYGIDLLVEIFTPEGEATGFTFWAQLKGTEKRKLSTYRIDNRFREYAQKFPVPFFLFYISTSADEMKYVHLQKYIEQNISKITKTGLLIKFPDLNTLSLKKAHANKNAVALEKIAKISRSLNFKVEGVTFAGEFFHMASQIEAINNQQHGNNRKVRKYLCDSLKALKGLDTLWRDNACQVSSGDVENIIQAVRTNKIDTLNDINSSFFNLKMLSNTFLHSDDLDDFIASAQGQALY